MTPLGHGLTGAAIGVLCVPDFKTKRAKALALACFVVLSLVPDLPVKGWGHEGGRGYQISHSLFVNLALVLLAGWALAWNKSFRRKIGGWPVIIGGALTWLSHLLLDTFYANAWWLCVLWPVYNRNLMLPLPWFENLEGYPPPMNAHNLKVLGIEFLFYFPFLLLAIYLRRKSIFKKKGA